jgi:hypothetical protein
MDNIPLVEEEVDCSLMFPLPSRPISKIDELETRIKILEDRLNLVMALKQNGLDLSKFCFDLKPI